MQNPAVKRLYFLLIFCVLSTHCDHGLSPDDARGDVRTGISGTIIYTGNWPPDSLINDLRLVVFKTIPTDSTQVISDVLLGNAKVYPENLEESLPYGVTRTDYEITLDPGAYEYIVVAQQYGSIFQWRLVGQYDTTPADSLPTGITVVNDVLLRNIDIRVDWANPPFQPF